MMNSSHFSVVAQCCFVLAMCLPTRGAGTGETVSSWGELARVAQGQSGFCVQLGGEAGSAAGLAEGGRLLVQVLQKEQSRVGAAREELKERGLYGRVTVDHWEAGLLPYADDLVNFLVEADAADVPESELRRVLAPGGTAWIRREAGWLALREPRPEGFDEWTHGRHGADGNMVSHDRMVAVPTGVRWVAGPAQDTGGKRWYYDHALVSARGRNYYAVEEGLCARDAYNGVLLWQRQIKLESFRETGTPVPSLLEGKVRLGGRMTKVGPVAAGDRLYVATEGNLAALDGATGQTAEVFDVVSNPRELLVEGDVLAVSDERGVRGYDVTSARRLWTVELAAERIVAGDGRLFCLSSNVIAAFNLGDGKPIWRTEDPKALPATTCTYHQGILVLEKSTWRDDPEGCGVLVYSGETGALLWARDYRTGMTHYQETRSFFAGDLLWLQADQSRVVGLDPRTGELQKSWGSRGLHCATPVATERFFIAPECEFTDLATGQQSRARMFKSACRLPFIPANGLLYSFPVQCECYPMLRGYMGLAATVASAGSAGPHARLIRKAPAERGAEHTSDPAVEWPIYRHDLYRSGSTPMTIRGDRLVTVWSVQVTRPTESRFAGEWRASPFVRGIVTPPVAAAGAVFVAVPDEHRVVALEARSGAPRWSFTAGGRIDTPPTIAEGQCFFGAHDGWVYCLDSVRGELRWRFSAAPQPTRILAYGQVESVWPVAGSVLVDAGKVYCVAGRHPKADGGVWVYALDWRTGEVIWEKTVNDLQLQSWYSPMMQVGMAGKRQKVGLDFEPVDLLVRDGRYLAMSRWRFQPETGDYELALTSTEYETPALDVPRGLWGYGIRQNKQVDRKPPAVFDQEEIRTGTAGETALLLAGGALVRASAQGEVIRGEERLALGAPAVPDGLAAAYGRLFVALQDGRVICLGEGEGGQ